MSLPATTTHENIIDGLYRTDERPILHDVNGFICDSCEAKALLPDGELRMIDPRWRWVAAQMYLYRVCRERCTCDG